MGFGFNLIFVSIILPLIGLLIVIFLITRKKIFSKALIVICTAIFGFVLVSIIVQSLKSPKKLNKKDYYGQYVINREYFSGKQADWQYNNFRFEIKENDSIFFYLTDKAAILRTYRGIITTTKPYASERLVINMEQPVHHIMTSNPTTYRSSWSFYLVFNSPKFGNVYFKKNEWKNLEN